MCSFWNVISHLCELRLTCYFLILCRCRLQLQMWLLILKSVEIHVDTCNPYNSCCSGKHCDKSDMYKNGQVQKFCTCHQMCSHLGEPGIVWGLNLTTRGGDCISTYDFSNTSFLFDWIKKDFRASYGRTIWMTMIHFLSLKQLALKWLMKSTGLVAGLVLCGKSGATSKIQLRQQNLFKLAWSLAIS